MARDVPDCVDGLSRSSEDTVNFRDTRRRNDQRWIPAFDPVSLEHRAKQREYSFWTCDEALSIGPRGTDWFDDLHVQQRCLKWLTVCVSGVWVGVDKDWEQKKPETRKTLENRAESHTSTARFVRRFLHSIGVIALNKDMTLDEYFGIPFYFNFFVSLYCQT